MSDSLPPQTVTKPGTSAQQAITVQGSATGVALPISSASLPLPAGAATETGNLASILAQLVSVLSTLQNGTQDPAPAVGNTEAPAPLLALLVAGREDTGDMHAIAVDGDGGVRVSVTSPTALPPNAAQESGNLATIASALTNGTQTVQVVTHPLPPNAAQETGNLALSQQFLSSILTEIRRSNVLLGTLVAATGNHVPDQSELDAQSQGDNAWPQ